MFTGQSERGPSCPKGSLHWPGVCCSYVQSSPLSNNKNKPCALHALTMLLSVACPSTMSLACWHDAHIRFGSGVYVCLSQQYLFCSLISSFLYASNLLTMTFIVIIIVIKNTCTFKSLETCAILVIFARRHMRKSTVFWTVRCFGHQ